MRKAGARQRGRFFFCDRVKYGSGHLSNNCLSAVSWRIIQLQWERDKYYRGRYICTYHVGIEAPFGYRNHRGIVLVRNISFLFVFLSARLQRALSLVSINSTAALSPPLAALPSQCPTPSSFPSVCMDPRGPRLPPGARHGPTSINISAGLRWWAERVSERIRAKWHFWERSGNGMRKFWWEMGIKRLWVVLHVPAH